MHWLRKFVDPSVPGRTRMLRAVLLGLLVVASVYRVWLIIRFNPMDALWSDPMRHWVFGTRPLDTQPLVAIDPFGYHVYIGALAKITAGSPVLVAYWTALLSLACPWLWYRFLRELLPSREWALAGCLLLSALPSWAAIYSYFMQETLLLPLLGAALWMTWRCRRKGDTASFLVAVGVWILAGLTRGICIPLAAAAVTWMWFGQGAKLEKAALSALLLLAVLGPLVGRTWYLVRQVTPYGVGTMNQLYSLAGTLGFTIQFSRLDGKERWRYEFASPSMYQYPLEPFSVWRSRREGSVHFAIDLDAGNRDWRAARDSLPPLDFERAAWLTGDNLVNLFFSQSWPDTNYERTIGQWNRWTRWIWAPLSIICLVWAIASRSRQRERLLPALIMVWFLFQGLLPLAVNEGRYRKPFEGLLVAQFLLLASTPRRTAKRAVELSPSTASAA